MITSSNNSPIVIPSHLMPALIQIAASYMARDGIPFTWAFARATYEWAQMMRELENGTLTVNPYSETPNIHVTAKMTDAGIEVTEGAQEQNPGGFRYPPPRMMSPTGR